LALRAQAFAAALSWLAGQLGTPRVPTGAVAGTDPDSRQVPSSRPRPGCTRRGKMAMRLRRRAMPSHTLPSR